VSASAGGLSPQIRILSGGEQRLLSGIGHVDPGGIGSYREHGGYAGLERAIAHLGAEGVINEIAQARLRGRGGGGYPAADKWRAARAGSADRRIVVANLMGADPAALGDRALAEGNPHLVLEGLLITAFAIGASEAIVAVRRDWTAAIAGFKAAIAQAEEARLAGYLVMGTDFSCQVTVQEGSGALVAGEETALLASLAGDRGMPVIRPPYPAERGLWDAPTVVHNGETLAHVAWIMSHSAEAFASVGSEASPGTKLVTIYGKVPQPGVAEIPMGTSVDELLRLSGVAAGSAKAVFVGGPGGGALSGDELGLPYDFDELRAAGAGIGLGQVLVTDAATCMVDTARFFLDWSAREACGKAVPCRIGTRRLVEALDRILAATPRPNDFNLLRELSRKMTDTALCNLEARAPNPMLSTLARFPDEYRAHAERGECLAGACQTPAVAPLVAPLSDVEPASPAPTAETR
jgi:NADH:ubiquinone oxidoreductase subunit F (NADH-binding)